MDQILNDLDALDRASRGHKPPYPWWRGTVAGYFLGLLSWLATGFMLGLGMSLGQVLAG